MSLAATVLIPTHDHGPLLLHSTRSALAQTVQDIEVFIVGDGASDVTRQVAIDLARQDERIRFFDNPKGPRRGEVYRHAALAHARGEIVCYLGDDDLWLPDHIESMRQLLGGADFAHALPVYVDGRGQINIRVVDLALPLFREMHLAGVNRFGLSFAAHTLEMYRQLPWGWRTTPEDVYTDLYMWQQFLAQPHCRAISATRPTVVSFPATLRRHQTQDQRVAELEQWLQKVSDAQWRATFTAEVLDRVTRDHARLVATQYRWALGALRKRLLYLWWSGGPKGEHRRARLLPLPMAKKLIRSVGEALIGPLAR